MPNPLRILFIEDSADDAAELKHHLENGGYVVQAVRISTAEEMEKSIAGRELDLVISEFNHGAFSPWLPLELLRGAQLDIPFLIVTGKLSAEDAVAMMKAGASDYILKDDLPRLLPAIERELREAANRKRRRDAERALHQAVRIRDEFLSIASHELKTPLTALKFQVHLLTRLLTQEMTTVAPHAAPGFNPKFSSRLSPVLQALNRQVNRLSKLVENILEISKLHDGPLELHREPVDLSLLVKDVVHQFCAGLNVSSCPILITAESPVMGSWDRHHLEEVMINLLSNAVIYGMEKPVEIRVLLRNNRAILEIHDSGIGIAKDDQKRIFEQFERAVTTEHFGGLGLGLYIASRIIEVHGGAIRVDSELGKGATFIVELPVSSPPEERSAA